jgi:hypothetical protein
MDIKENIVKQEMGLFVFDTTHDTVKAEKLLLENRIEVEAIPTPTKISSNCGISLLCQTRDYDIIDSVLEKNDINRIYHIINFRMPKKRI